MCLAGLVMIAIALLQLDWHLCGKFPCTVFVIGDAVVE
jgi:hypothetical protein